MISKTEIDGQKMVIEELKRIKEGIKVTIGFLSKCSSDNVSMKSIIGELKFIDIPIDNAIAKIQENIDMFVKETGLV